MCADLYNFVMQLCGYKCCLQFATVISCLIDHYALWLVFNEHMCFVFILTDK